MGKKIKNVTMKDVARFANVAIGTVDRVLNNTGYASPEKTDAVERAVRRLGYVPNRAASVLSKRKTVNIGVVYPNKEVYFWAQINKGIQRAEKQFGPYGLNVVRDYFESYNPDEQLAFLERFVDGKELHGLAFVPLHPSLFNPLIDRLDAAGVPVVTFDNDAPASRRVCFVGEDSVRGGRLAGRLVSLFLGERGRVAVLRGQPNFLCIQERVLGFTEKMASEYPGIEIAEFYDMYDKVDDTRYMDRIQTVLAEIEAANPPIDALFVTNALVNYVGGQMRSRPGLKGVRVIGFDYNEETGALIRDGVVSAVVAADLEEEGYAVIRTLYDCVFENRRPESRCHITEFNIKIRETIE